MKLYVTAIIATIIMIMLTSLQFCLFSYQNHSQFSPALIGYIYILMTNCSMTLLTTFAIILDSITYLITGVFGLSILCLVPISWLALKLKNDMYNKIVIPGCMFFLYTIFYNILLAWYIAYPIHIGQIFYATFQNFSIFLIVWSITKQPFHD